MNTRTCSEIGCENPVERGHSRCPACREYITEIKQHDKAERDEPRLTQVGMNKWKSDDGYIYEGEGEDSWLDNDTNDSYLDGRE